MIVLEMNCPQLSKPEATAARNENSIGDRMEKKTLGETRLSRWASSPPARWISSLFQLQQSQSVSGPLFPGVFPQWMSRWRGPHWRSVSGAHLCVLDSADGQGCRGCLNLRGALHAVRIMCPLVWPLTTLVHRKVKGGVYNFSKTL